MNEQITLQMLPRSRIEHDSHWISIKHRGERVGFIKGVIEGNTVTIEFLHMFDEFGGCGYALRAIEALKSKFTVKLNENDLWLGVIENPSIRDRNGYRLFTDKEISQVRAEVTRVTKGSTG